MRLAIAAANDSTIVAVGSESEVVDKTIGQVRSLLLIGLPLLLLLVAAITWVTAGRALAPVERIRQTAREIGDGPIDQRVPVPGTNDEIGRLADTMNHMLDRLDANQRMQARFTSDASHELRSPVANFRLVAETAQLDDAAWPATQRQLLGEADRVASIVENLLYLSIADEAVPLRQGQLVNLDDLLFDEAATLAARGRTRVDIGGVGPAQGDPDALGRLVRNLADNAERHASSRVWFECSASTDHALLRVYDDGPGIPPDKREKVFE